MKRLLFAGGGTAGHLMSGISVAQKLKEKFEVAFFCSPRESDAALLSYHGLRHKVVHTTNRPPWNLQTAFFESLRHFAALRPDAVVGLGGYASVPPLLNASMLGIPIFLIEQNTIPGKVNRLFSRAARRFYSIWDLPARFSPGSHSFQRVGGIIKDGLTKHDKLEAKRRLGLPEEKRAMLVLGGSQGSSFINNLIPKIFEHISADNLSVIHIAVRDSDRVEKSYEQTATTRVFGFTKDMSLHYSAADFAICRSGAGTVCELAYYGLPAIFIPFEFSADGHQIENARYLSMRGAGICIREFEATPEKIADSIRLLVSDRVMGQMLHSLIGCAGADIIAGDLGKM